MRRAHRSYLPGLIVLLSLLALVAPQAVAQDMPPETTCPEGLVYYASGDICLLPENVPAEEEPVEDVPAEEPVEEPVDEGEPPAEELPAEAPVDEGEQPAEEEPVDEEPVDEEPVDEPAPAIAGDQDVPLIDFLTSAAAERGTIKNLTLLTFACPINWNPATRPIEESREMCTEPIVDAMNYTILYEGREWVTAGLGSDVDMATDRGDLGVPLPAGMWTIRENLQEGLEDPFAFCAIYAADGTSRLTVQETIVGGSLDILLAAGEEVNCEWYSVATVPEVSAAPSLGLEVKVFSCPAPAEFKGGLDECTLPLPGPVTFEALYDGEVMATGTLDSTEFPYEVDQEAPSGEWTIRPILAEGWIDPHATCWSVDYAGAYTGEITHVPPADGSLGVTVQLNPDQRAQCQIWLFAGDVRESVVVVTRDCPEDYDAATLSPGVRKATCPGLQFQEVSITVDDAAPVLGESTRNGVAVFPTQPGLWRIAVNPGLGVVGREITFVTCDHTLAALGQVQTIEPTINADRRSVSIDLDEGDALRCDFYFGPAATAQQPPAAEEGAGTDVPAAEEEAGMEDTGTGTETDETTDTGALETGTDDVPGDATDVTTDENAEAGDEGAGMDASTGAGNPGAGIDSPTGSSSFGGGSAGTDAGTGTGESAAQPANDTTAPDATSEGGTADAPPTEGTSTLSIQHYDCTNPVTDATVDDLVANCTASVAPSAWVMNGEPLDVGDGYAVWEGLEPDTVSVSNAAAGGKEDGSSTVYCSIAPVGSEPLVGIQVPVRNEAIEISFDQPSVVYCAWFVAP